MNLREKKRQHNVALEQLRELDKKDSLNEEEEKKFDKLYLETRSLKTEIEKRERIKELELSVVPNVKKPKVEKRSFSLGLAIKNLISGRSDGFEGEVSQELRNKGQPSNPNSVFVPAEVLFGKQPQVEKRFLDNQANLISDPIRPSEYLSGLYEKSILPKLGCKMITAQGEFSFPTSAGVSAGWFSGTGSDAISESDPTYTTTELKAKYLGVYSGWSLAQLTNMSKNDLSLESILREDLLGAMASEMDKAAFTADGTSNAPKGLITLLGSTKETSIDLHGTNEWALSQVVDPVKRIQVASKMQMSKLAWVVSPEVSAELQQKQKFASSNGEALMENGAINGIPAGVTNWLSAESPATATGNIEAIIGDFSQFLCVQYGAVELVLGQINDDAIKKVTRLIAHSAWDFAVRRADFFRMIRCDRTA